MRAPAFICRARPRGAQITRSAAARANSRVPSRLPPSVTMISQSSACRTAASVRAMTSASSRVGTMTLTRMSVESPADAEKGERELPLETRLIRGVHPRTSHA